MGLSMDRGKQKSKLLENAHHLVFFFVICDKLIDLQPE